MADEVLGWALNDGCHLHPEPEPVFKCPRCHAVRPRSEWEGAWPVVTVVSVKGLRTPEQRSAVCYCGPANARWPASPLGNPFRGHDAVGRFSDWLKDHPHRDKLLADVWEACGRGVRPLGCWCVSKPWVVGDSWDFTCHAQVIAAELSRMVSRGMLPPPA